MPARHKATVDPDQADALTRWGRRYHSRRAGIARYWKQWTNRRERRAAERDIRNEETDG